MYGVFMLNRDAFLEHYHKRSSVESAYSMVKAKFGDSLRSKSYTGRIKEALSKILAHNLSVLCYAMHRLATEPNLCAYPPFRPTAAQIPYGKEVVSVAKARKYHRVKGYSRQGQRVPAHVRRMPKSCKKK